MAVFGVDIITRLKRVNRFKQILPEDDREIQYLSIYSGFRS